MLLKQTKFQHNRFIYKNRRNPSRAENGATLFRPASRRKSDSIDFAEYVTATAADNEAPRPGQQEKFSPG